MYSRTPVFGHLDSSQEPSNYWGLKGAVFAAAGYEVFTQAKCPSIEGVIKQSFNCGVLTAVLITRDEKNPAKIHPNDSFILANNAEYKYTLLLIGFWSK